MKKVNLKKKIKKNKKNKKTILKKQNVRWFIELGDWGLGVGVGIGDWGLRPVTI